MNGGQRAADVEPDLPDTVGDLQPAYLLRRTDDHPAPRRDRFLTVPSTRAPPGGGPAVSETDETFRRTLRVRSADNELATLIILRRGLGRAARVWLTFDGATKTTAVLTREEATRLLELIDRAREGAS